MKHWFRRFIYALGFLTLLVGSLVFLATCKNYRINNHNAFQNARNTDPVAYQNLFYGSFRVGVADAVITPDGEISLAGFRPRRSEGVHDDLFAKAMVLSDPQGEKIVIIVLDLIGFVRHDEIGRAHV